MLPKAKIQPAKHIVALTQPSIGVTLLDWYDRHARDLPWRSRPGVRSDPYAVWLSEIMLQQTTVAAVKPYYASFLQRWPTVQAMADAPLEDVLKAWAGLGYYSRARNLHACAQRVAEINGGQFPGTEGELRTLPGIGAYTAAAIAAIAFGQRAIVVDGNVERVMARVNLIELPLPQARPLIRAAMDAATPELRSGDFAQAVMDLGSTVCTPRSPACVICPIRLSCKAAAAGRAAELPRKLPKRAVPIRRGAVFFVQREDGDILVRTRPTQGLFGGMTELPGTVWNEDFDFNAREALPPGLTGPVQALGRVEHGLTHFKLHLDVFSAKASAEACPTDRWVAVKSIYGEALPTLMRKVVDIAIKATSTS